MKTGPQYWTELTRGISCSHINVVSQNEIETVEVASCCSQMKPGKQDATQRKIKTQDMESNISKICILDANTVTRDILGDLERLHGNPALHKKAFTTSDLF